MNIDLPISELNEIENFNDQDLSPKLSGFFRAHKRNPIALNRLGNILCKRNMFVEARSAYQAAIEVNPNDHHAWNNKAYSEKKLYMYTAALLSHRKALQLKPDFFEGYLFLADLLNHLERYPEALEALAQCHRLDPNINSQYVTLSQVHLSMGNVLEASRNINLASLLEPSSVSIKIMKASIEIDSGNLIGARDLLAELIYNSTSSVNSAYCEAHYLFSRLEDYSQGSNHIVILENILNSDNLSDEMEAQICFALYKAKHEQKEYAQAINLLGQGNEAIRRKTSWSFDRHVDLHRSIVRCYDNVRGLEVDEVHCPKMLFIVGMPRSGTTLMERILSMHDYVKPLGERRLASNLLMPVINDGTVTSEKLRQFTQSYCNALNAKNENIIFIDKMPHNFRLLGLILKALPGARAINMIRDPRDVCWSNYCHKFEEPGLGYSTDLNETVDFYSEYSEFMRVWRMDFSSRILDVSYENLTDNLEFEVRRVSDFLEIEFDVACLSLSKSSYTARTASRTQVKEPIKRSLVHAWTPYRDICDEAWKKLSHVSEMKRYT